SEARDALDAIREDERVAERNARTGRDGFDAGHGPHGLGEALVKRDAPPGVREPYLERRNAHGDEPARVEAEVDAAEIEEALHEEARAAREHGRERDCGRDERAAQPQQRATRRRRTNAARHPAHVAADAAKRD